ncbi:MAG: hypothetical protein ABSC45_12130 [Desulfobaccales bacterium]|jgi:hypothetical protein
MLIAMDSSVMDRFERILRNIPILSEQEENALVEIIKSGTHFCKLPSNVEYFQKNKSGFHAEGYLGKCREVDDQSIKKRMTELIDPDEVLEDLEDEYKFLAEAEESGVEVILTTLGNFINDLAKKTNKVKIMKPTDYVRKYLRG